MALPPYIDLQIVTPDRMLVQDRVDEVQIPGAEGYLGVLPGHTPLLASLAVGELWYRKGQEKTYLSIAFGFAEILPDRVKIRARIAERAEDVDLARAEAARKRAEERLHQLKAEIDQERARVALIKSVTRIQVSSRITVRRREVVRG
jgi:F-type H+-transporting ATPase subunit epsilon